jgi:pimeloyl-ACP methyl ester carboxylesterase
MGSELVDTDGRVVWGLSAGLLGRLWVTGQTTQLVVRDAERAGAPRLRPSRLLRRVGFLPFLGGLEPYTAMTLRLADVVPSPQAVFEFPYDWRLSIEYNAQLLAVRCEEVLKAWRAVVTRERYSDSDQVRVTIVAHSMGGLVSRYAAEVCGAAPLVRQIITLGTPYFGAVKSVQMLANGEGARLPHRAARELARSCPGVYDLLPRYRCVTPGIDQNGKQTPDRHFSNAEAAAVGADAALAREAATRYTKLAEATAGGGAVPVLPLVGADQPTLQRLSIDSGEAQFFRDLDGTDHAGDSTVYRGAAAPRGATAFPLPQHHGALAKTAEALTFVSDKLTGADTGPPLGTRPVGADIPEFASAGMPVRVRVTGTDDPIGVTITSVDVETGARTSWMPGARRDGGLLFVGPVLKPGLHRVEVKAGGFSPISDLLLIAEQPTAGHGGPSVHASQ